jgi:hypothetical protein
MKLYNELKPRGKIIRMILVRIVVYGALLIAFYLACARLYRTINKVRTPAKQDKSLPVAGSSCNCHASQSTLSLILTFNLM